MAILQHLAVLKQGVGVWNGWRKDNPGVRPDLSGADLPGANLHGADLSHTSLNDAEVSGAILVVTNLSGANLSGTNLSGASLNGAELSGAILVVTNLSSANLSGANLSNAHLSRAILNGADLSRASLRGADLQGANLRRALLNNADLDDANLSGAFVPFTVFVDVDLRTVRGLDSVRHDGPSTIGIDTIYRSQGQIPESFLRGAGVPENFITFMRSLTGAALDFYSCFISYSSKDQKFAERLHADLQAKNVRCWFAPEDLKIGDRLQERVEESVRVFDKVMIVLSEASVTSRWVEREVNAAMEREEREKRTVLFPIRIDDAVMDAPQPWAADIRRLRHIGDFRCWKNHEEYVKALDRLLRDLRASKEAAH